MKRYKINDKFMFNVEKGITVNVFKDESGKLIVEAQIQKNDSAAYAKLPVISAGEYAKTKSVYIDRDGYKAIVPPSYTVSKLESENQIRFGLVIYQIPEEELKGINWNEDYEKLKKTYDQYVFFPSGLIKANGVTCYYSKEQQIGRRKWNSNDENSLFVLDLEDYSSYYESRRWYAEPLKGELEWKIKKAEKYGGFYVGRYPLSINPENQKLQVVYGNPLIENNINNAKEWISQLEKPQGVNIFMPFGAEYDSLIEWFIEKNASRRKALLFERITHWEFCGTGEIEEIDWIKRNEYKKTEVEYINVDVNIYELKINDTWDNNICNFCNEYAEWTQEKYIAKNIKTKSLELLSVARGGGIYNEYLRSSNGIIRNSSGGYTENWREAKGLSGARLFPCSYRHIIIPSEEEGEVKNVKRVCRPFLYVD